MLRAGFVLSGFQMHSLRQRRSSNGGVYCLFMVVLQGLRSFVVEVCGSLHLEDLSARAS